MTELMGSLDDVVQLCQICQRPLGRSPSDDFCSEGCQQRWHAQSSHQLPEQRRR